MKIVSNRKKYFLISGVIIFVGIMSMIFNLAKGNGAFNYAIDFVGGAEITMDIGQEFNNDDIAEIVTQTTGNEDPQVQKVNGTNTVVVKVKTLESTDTLYSAINEKYAIPDDSGKSVSYFSPMVTQDMRRKSFQALGIASITMLIYVSIRFRDLKTGGTAILALIHDALIVLSFYAIFRIPLNTAFVAAILTILGYSINSTIVVFDRIRENKKLMKGQDLETILDKSVNQTMRRSVYTSLTTLITIVCLYILGVESVKQFSLPIIVGIISGTYSSVFLASSFLYIFSNKDNEIEKDETLEKIEPQF